MYVGRNQNEQNEISYHPTLHLTANDFMLNYLSMIKGQNRKEKRDMKFNSGSTAIHFTIGGKAQ